MNASTLSIESEPRQTYLKAVVFTLPAMIAWLACSMFLLPVLRELWDHAGFAAPLARIAMNASRYFQWNFLVLMAIGGAVLLTLEWRSRSWAKNRAKVLWAGAFLLNMSVLVFITAMFSTAILSARVLLMAK